MLLELERPLGAAAVLAVPLAAGAALRHSAGLAGSAPAQALAVAGGLLALLLAWLWRPTPPLDASNRVVPGPCRGLPCIGATLEVIGAWETILDWMLLHQRRAGWGTTWGFTTLRLGGFAGGVAVLATPQAVEHVLKTNFEKYEKGAAFRAVLGDFLGAGIFASDGPAWRFHRKVAVQMFSKRLLQEGTATALANCTALVRRLDAAAVSGEPVELQAVFFAFTMDTFAELAFGVQLNSQDQTHRFATAFDTAQRLCNERFRLPWFGLLRALQASAAERRITAEVAIMRSFALELVRARRAELRAGSGGEKADLISRFLGAEGKWAELRGGGGGGGGGGDGGGGFTDEELADMVLNFIIAGRDTTACALSWGTLRLLRAPAAAAAARAELDAAVGGGSSGAAGLHELPPDDVFELVQRKLPYLKAVMSETLRLHPSVPKDGKYAVAADTLPDGTTVRKGCFMLWSNYCLGRDPTIWGPDSETFRPERWLQNGGGGGGGDAGRAGAAGAGSLWRPTTQVSDFQYPVFNGGPRLCLGRPLAYLEMQLVLGAVLSRYELAEAPGCAHTDEYINSIVAPMKKGLTVTVKRRRSA